jgi:outer membrane protein assembly factor BamA
LGFSHIDSSAPRTHAFGAYFLFHIFILAGLAAADGINLNLEGEKAFSPYELREILPEEPGKLNNDEVSFWAEDAGYELEQYYLEHGFFEVEVKARTERPDPSDKQWVVTLTIQEGRRYRYGRVRVILDGDSANARLTSPDGGTLSARQGRGYREEHLTRDMRDLTRFYGNAGFVRADVRENVVLRDSGAVADVDYLVTRGVPVVFDALRLSIRRTNNDSLEGLTRGKLLRSLVPYKRGDTVRADENDAVIEKLQSTGQYTSVRLDDSLYADGRPGSVLTLDVEEKVPGRATASVFYETQYGFGVSGTAKHSNIAGTLNEVRAGAGFAQNKQNASLGYGSPLTLGMLLRFEDDLSVAWYQDNLPDEPFFGGDLRVANVATLSRNLYYWLRLVGGAEVEYKNTIVSDSNGVLSRESGGLLNFTTTAFFSFLDQSLNPAKGTRYALTLGNGGSIYEQGQIDIFQERHNWVEFQSAYYYYPPFLPQFKTALRFDAGRFFGTGGQNADRFFLGGPRSVRSYGFRQLCPDQDAPARGSCPLDENPLEPAYFLVSGELRLTPFDFPVIPPRGFIGFFKPMEFVPFVDFGKVWNLQGDENESFSVTFANSGYGQGIAYGGGIRYPFLGIFNLRLDFAWGRPGPGSFFGKSGENLPDQWIVDLAQAF